MNTRTWNPRKVVWGIIIVLVLLFLIYLFLQAAGHGS